MTIARRQMIDVSITLWYHRMSRCIRGALWLGGDSSDRKSWLVHSVRPNFKFVHKLEIRSDPSRERPW
jgi:hypothetical protein